MIRVIEQLVEEPRPCSYLVDRSASLEHHIMLETSPTELEALFERGWRRFGPDYFRPVCPTCRECVPLRIPTASFVPSKSQRRARDKCRGLRVEIGPPRVDDERLNLYHLWHASREGARGWLPSELDRRTYALQFSFPHPAAREVAYYEDGPRERLVGVGLCDRTPRAWSAAYFFYDPAWAKASLGVANVIFQIEYARSLGLDHVYLGYRVAGCASLEYKARYRPQERLVGWPGPHDAPQWITAT